MKGFMSVLYVLCVMFSPIIAAVLVLCGFERVAVLVLCGGLFGLMVAMVQLVLGIGKDLLK